MSIINEMLQKNSLLDSVALISHHKDQSRNEYTYKKLFSEARSLSEGLFEGQIVGILFDENCPESIYKLIKSIVAAISAKKTFFILDPSDQSWQWILEAVDRLKINIIISTSDDCCDQINYEEKKSYEGFWILKISDVNDQDQGFLYIVQTSGTTSLRENDTRARIVNLTEHQRFPEIIL